MAARRSWPRPVIRPSAPWRWLPVGRRRCCSSSTLPLAPDSPAPLKLARNRFSDHDRLSISFVLDSLTRTGCLDAGGFLVASGRGQHLWTHFSHGWPTFFFCTNLKLQMAQQVSCCDALELDVTEFFFGRIVFALAVVYWVERGCRSPSALLMASGRRILHSRFVFTGFSRGVTEFWWLVPPWRAWSFSTRLEPSFFFFCFYFWPNPSSWRRFRSMLTGWRRVSTTTTRCLRNFETKPTRFWWRGAFGFDSRGFFLVVWCVFFFFLPAETRARRWFTGLSAGVILPLALLMVSCRWAP